MPQSFKQFGLGAINGEDKSTPAAIARGVATAIEPFYSGVMRARNAFYDWGLFRSNDLGRFTISVGNITTGGTGKTPVVKWLADQLRQIGRHPAILLRGYGSNSSEVSDEAQLLDRSLNADSQPRILVEANPSRVQGALDVLCRFPATDVFVLDDGFQHRRAKRDFNLVLVSATKPFGFGHVLPRGLLREPLAGLGRADAFLITRCSLASPEAVGEIDAFLGSRYPEKPIYHCDHIHSEIWIPANGQSDESIADKKIFLTGGIGDPVAFEKQMRLAGCEIVGRRWFSDHHNFSESEIRSLLTDAKPAGADLVVTTEKDWVKIEGKLPGDAGTLPIGVAKLEIQFRDKDGQRLLDRIEERIQTFKSAAGL